MAEDLFTSLGREPQDDRAKSKANTRDFYMTIKRKDVGGRLAKLHKSC